jgi:NADP-dependent 3-hydroxy acid dehydrogenase YdfG
VFNRIGNVKKGLSELQTLKDQIALVTGASGGIGGAIASALAERGVRLCLAARDQSKLDALASLLVATSSRVDCRSTDLTKDEDIRGLARFVTDQFGRLDILVHCAGTINHGKLETTSIASLDRQFTANVRGPLLLTQLLLPLLKKPRGQVVFINSSAGLTAGANTGHFSATQHAFKAIADSLREEVNSENVRVLSVFPGRTATPRIQTLHANEGQPYKPELLLQPADVASVVLNAVSLAWTAEVTNISIRPMVKSYQPITGGFADTAYQKDASLTAQDSSVN